MYKILLPELPPRFNFFSFLKLLQQLNRVNTSIAVMKCKVSQRYLIKSLQKKKNSNWDIQKILIFAVENKELRVYSNLVSSTLQVVTATLVIPQ
jgi:hypothetical protein